MAEQEEKSYFMVIVAVCAVLSIVLVLTLKADEVKHLEMKGSNTTLEGNAQALHSAKRYNNVLEQ
ncbi:MAG: hypothetical protein GQ532_20360 [Methylomarinum sp.]|nr:hypothetical protein [Methylococcales bacterium]NOR72004.1 hypothetical protein [Methylomarinum sp.]